MSDYNVAAVAGRLRRKRPCNAKTIEEDNWGKEKGVQIGESLRASAQWHRYLAPSTLKSESAPPKSKSESIASSGGIACRAHVLHMPSLPELTAGSRTSHEQPPCPCRLFCITFADECSGAYTPVQANKGKTARLSLQSVLALCELRVMECCAFLRLECCAFLKLCTLSNAMMIITLP